MHCTLSHRRIRRNCNRFLSDLVEFFHRRLLWWCNGFPSWVLLPIQEQWGTRWLNHIRGPLLPARKPHHRGPWSSGYWDFGNVRWSCRSPACTWHWYPRCRWRWRSKGHPCRYPVEVSECSGWASRGLVSGSRWLVLSLSRNRMHYNQVIWTLWRLKLPSNWLIVQQLGSGKQQR